MFLKKIAIHWNRDEIIKVCIALAAALLLEIFCILFTSHYIQIYSGETQEKQGVLMDVWRATRKGAAGLVIMVDGQKYQLEKPSFSKKTYGLKNSPNMNALVEELKQKTGSAWSVNLEYVQFAKNYRVVMHMMINGEEYVNEEVARRDHVADQAGFRNGAIVFLVLTVLLFVVLMKHLREIQRI